VGIVEDSSTGVTGDVVRGEQAALRTKIKVMVSARKIFVDGIIFSALWKRIRKGKFIRFIQV
jgi:hypothetical protein